MGICVELQNYPRVAKKSVMDPHLCLCALLSLDLKELAVVINGVDMNSLSHAHTDSPSLSLSLKLITPFSQYNRQPYGLSLCQTS